MFPSISIDRKSKLIALAVHHNAGGKVVYTISLCLSEGSYTVVAKSGKSFAEIRKEKVVYRGNNAILAKDAYGKEVQRVGRICKSLSRDHWMYVFAFKDHRTSGGFSKNVFTGKPPMW